MYLESKNQQAVCEQVLVPVNNRSADKCHESFCGHVLRNQFCEAVKYDTYLCI